MGTLLSSEDGSQNCVQNLKEAIFQDLEKKIKDEDIRKRED